MSWQTLCNIVTLFVGSGFGFAAGVLISKSPFVAFVCFGIGIILVRAGIE